MTDSAISGLTAVASPALTDEYEINQPGTGSRKITGTQLVALFRQLGALPRAFALAAAHTISSATATKVGFSTVTLEAGTYQFQYFLILSHAATGTGIRIGLNFTGTAAVRAFEMRYPSTGTTANTGIADDVGATTGQLHESNPQTAFSTATPNMGNAGVATATGRYLAVVEGTIVVTASGDLELWHGSSTAAATTVDGGSTLTVVRCA